MSALEPLGSVDVYGMFYALRDMLPPRARITVDSLRDNAAGYTWGIEDGSGQVVTAAYGREVIAAWEFPIMYGIYACLYELGQLGSRNAVPNAYRAFRAGVDISEYVS